MSDLSKTGGTRDNTMKIGRNGWLALLIPLLLISMTYVTAPAFSEEPDEECPDGWITTKVITKLTFKGMVKIDVSTEECVVTLRGCTKTEEKRKAAIDAAKNTKYVKNVVNKIELCPDDEPDEK